MFYTQKAQGNYRKVIWWLLFRFIWYNTRPLHYNSFKQM